MTQDQLAEKIGYHGKSAISHIEKGDSDMSQSKIVAIAAALDTTVDYILGLEDGSEVTIERRIENPTIDTTRFCSPTPPSRAGYRLDGADIDLLLELIPNYLRLETCDKEEINDFVKKLLTEDDD